MRARSLAALVGVMLVSMTGFGAFLPIFPFLALSTGAPASAITWAFGAYSLGQFVAAPLWGRLSDRIGRKPVLAAGMMVSAISYLVMAHTHTVLEMGLVRLIGGLMAGGSSAAFAAAADLADDKTRARNMGLLGAAVGFGFIAGPALGAVLVSGAPTRAHFERICELTAALNALAAAGALFLFQETNTNHAAPSAPRFSLQLLRADNVLAGFIATSVVLMIAQSLMEATFGLWGKAAFDWGPREIGYTLAGMGVGAALLQGGGAGAAARRFGEALTLRAGLATFALGLVLLAAAQAPWMAYGALAFVTLGIALATPALQSLVAKQADEQQRGGAMGLNQSAGALGRVIGPALSGIVFDTFGHWAPYALGGALLLGALLLVPRLQAQPA